MTAEADDGRLIDDDPKSQARRRRVAFPREIAHELRWRPRRRHEIWLTLKEAEIRRGDWMNPDAGRIPFGEYAQTWINDHVLKPRTEELYRGLLKNHLSPTFGNMDLRDIRESDIRRWRKERLAAGPRQDRPFGPVTVAKAYRLLHIVLNTATDDQLIRRNPCRIKGAGQEDSPERAVIPLTTLIELLDQVRAD